MDYTLSFPPPPAHPYSPVITRLYVDTWQKVFRVLQILHDRHLDFILTPDVEYYRGWRFEIAQAAGSDSFSVEKFLRLVQDD